MHMTHAPLQAGQTPARILVIYNPTAGQWRQRRMRAILAAIEAKGARLTLRQTAKSGDAENLAREIDATSCDVLVAAGGDGTINEVANGLMRRAPGPVPPLALIPLGTANVLAREIGLCGGPQAIAEALLGGGRLDIHPGRANGRHFLMMAGVGFDAHVVANIDLALKRRAGKIAYVLETLAQAWRYGFPLCRVSLAGEVHEARSVVVCNGRHYGGPFIAAPKARLDAPAFEVVLLEQGGWRHVLRYGLALLRGRLGDLPDVKIIPGNRLSIDGPPGLPVQGDGDIIAHLPADIDVAAGTLTLVVPQ